MSATASRVIQFVLFSIMTIVIVVIGLESVVGVDLQSVAENFETVSPVSGPSLLVLLLIVGVVGIGGRSTYIGIRSLLSATRIGFNKPVPAREIHSENGAVEVQGTAEPVVLESDVTESTVEATITAPTSRKTCLAYTWEKKEKRQSSTRGSDDTWSTTGQEDSAVPFYVADDTGKVGIDPTAATLSLKPSVERKQERAREYEGRLHPGDTVHIYGYKHEATESADQFGDGRMYTDERLGEEPVSLGDRLADVAVYIGAGTDGGTFKISDTSELRTTIRSTVRGLVHTIGGLLLISVAVVTFLVYF